MQRIKLLLLLLCSAIMPLQAQKLSAIPKSPKDFLNLPYGHYPLAGKYVQSQDAKIYYEVYGKGQPIVLLHGGIMGYMDEMAEFIENLQDSYQVIVVGSRGHGKSEIGHQAISMELKARDVMQVVNALTQQPVIVLGFSDGAYTAYHVAHLFPQRVKKMIAIGAGEQVPGLRTVHFSGEAFDLNNDFWKARLSLMPEPNRIQDFWKDMQRMYNAMQADKALFNSINCPVLVLAGENDKNALLPSVISAYQMLPNSQLSIIPNTGHVVFKENFPAVWASIVPFLNQN